VANDSAIEVSTVDPLPPDTGFTLIQRLLKNILSPLPYSVQKHHRANFRDVVRRQIETWHPSLIHCEWGPYACYLQDHGDLPAVVVAHNVESTIWSRRATVATHPVSKWFFGMQARRMERFERQFAPRVAAVVSVSDLDAEVFRSWRANVVTVDNGVDLNDYSPAPAPEEPGRVLFLASLDWFPNLDALDYYVREIHPLLRQANQDVSLCVVGRRLPVRDAERLAQIEQVQVIGEVADVRTQLNRAAVVVVPLRIGGGSRLKILEALAAGKAVVSTSVGAEGLAVRDHIHLRIADGAANFAQAVQELLADPASRRRLGVEGRRLVEQRYGWDALAQKMAQVWASAVQSEARG
jgi:polysaccharide biosynthesis protein PslH